MNHKSIKDIISLFITIFNGFLPFLTHPTQRKENIMTCDNFSFLSIQKNILLYRILNRVIEKDISYDFYVNNFSLYLSNVKIKFL